MPLTRDEVLRTALVLLDDVGLDQLTMRRLATHLGVRHGALYWHFADKQALLDAMADEVIAGTADIPADAPPFEQLAAIARRTRQALLARRDGARVVAGTFARGPNTAHAGDVLIRAARAAGAPTEEAALLGFSILEFVLGHTIEEQARTQRLSADQTLSVDAPIDVERYAELDEALAHVADDGRTERGFNYGLELLLAGARQRFGGTDRPGRS